MQFQIKENHMRNKFVPLIFSLLILSIPSKGQNKPSDINTIFPMGNKIKSENFFGEPWVLRMFAADSTFNCAVGNVTFEPKSRSNWHKHPGGQILLAIDGVGYYQEKGKELQVLRPGDTVKCPPNIEHWHGAAHDDWFVQLAITAEHSEGRVVWLNAVSDEEYQIGYTQLHVEEINNTLSNRHRHFILISSFTTKGDLEKLKIALNAALDDGLTINEVKESLVHLYAYCGFPRSIQGLITFLSVVDERKEKGIVDKVGQVASAIDQSIPKYERGRKVLETLVGTPVNKPTSGYGAFSPEIDTFLKEHLFSDIFERDVLSFQDREVLTISALTNLGGVDRMITGHMKIALNIGFSEAQINELINIIEIEGGINEIELCRNILSELVEENKE